MKEKRDLRKEYKTSGMENLLNVHTQALENNSESIVEILQLLSEKELSAKDRNALKKIRRELKGIDKTLDSLGKDTPGYGDDWF